MRLGSLISGSILLLIAVASPHLSAQARGFVRGGRGMSTSRVISPSVVASWMSHENYATGNKTTLLVLWRGTPGWISANASRAGGGGSSGGGGGAGSQAFEYFSQGGLTFTIQIDYDRNIAALLNHEISLTDTNVVLVDFVDAATGPAIVATTWIAPAPPDASAVDPVVSMISRTPELFDYLRCDDVPPEPMMKEMVSLLCDRMRPR